MNCAHCTAPMTGRKRMYCDKTCSNAAHAARHKPNCSADECTNPRNAAKGLCKTHYNRTLTERHKARSVACVWCGTVKQTTSGSAKRKYGFTCSYECRRLITFGARTELPADHWARWYGKTSDWAPRKDDAEPRSTFQCGTCADCAALIVEPATQTPSEYCSRSCARRSAKRRRRAREHGAPGDFTLTQIVKQYAKQGNTCAYCKQPAIGLPDPEHVLPLSRGGRNDMSNLVASCRACNTSKGDLTLSEWAAVRTARGLTAVDTTLHGVEYNHLYRTEATTSAWRHRLVA